MKTKTVYVATATVYQTDKRGNTKVLPVGTEIAAKVYETLTANQKAKFEAVVKNTGRVRFSGGVVTDLPVIDGVIKTVFRPGEYHLLPVEVHNLVNEVEALWTAAHPEIPFPGVSVDEYCGDRHLTWWIWSNGLPATATPMFSTSNHMCALKAKRDRVGAVYQYRTASLLKTAERLRSGRPVFATAEEAIGRLLAG